MTDVVGVLGGVVYVVAGLFISRAWWRNAKYQDDEAQLVTLGIFMFWPAALAAWAVGVFIAWFYNM